MQYRILLALSSLLVMIAGSPAQAAGRVASGRVWSRDGAPSLMALKELPGQRLAPREVFNAWSEGRFTVLPLGSERADFTGPVWVAYPVSGATGAEGGFEFEVWRFPIRAADLFVFEGDRLVERDSLRPEEHKIEVPYDTIGFSVPKNHDRLVLLRLDCRDRCRIPTVLRARANHDANILRREQVNGILFGVGVGLTLYNLFLFFALGNISFLYYVAYSFFSWLFIYSETGYLTHFFSVEWYKYRLLCILLAITFAVVFARDFLETAKRLPRFNRLINATVAVLLLAAAVQVFFPDLNEGAFMKTAMDIGLPAGVMLLLLAGIFSLKNGSSAARYYLISWSAVFAAVLIWVGEWRGWIPQNSVTAYRIPLGLAFETVLMSIGLAHRMNRSRREYENALTLHSEALEKRVQEQGLRLAQSAKMAALGEMAGGIAHEINNPLVILEARASLLKRLIERSDGDPETKLRAVATIRETVARIARIVKSLKTFARESKEDEPQRVALFQIVRESLELCAQRFAQHGIRLEVPTEDTGIELDCRPGEISNVLLNLLSNAFDAASVSEEGWVRLRVLDQGDWAELRVEDSGHGVPVVAREKIFEPFFTTKGVDRGTGLGLSISHGLVKAHGGELLLDAQSPFTAFVMRLPKVSQPKASVVRAPLGDPELPMSLTVSIEAAPAVVADQLG